MIKQPKASLKQLNVRVSPVTLAQLAELAAAGHGTVTQIIIKAIDRLAQSELGTPGAHQSA